MAFRKLASFGGAVVLTASHLHTTDALKLTKMFTCMSSETVHVEPTQEERPLTAYKLIKVTDDHKVGVPTPLIEFHNLIKNYQIKKGSSLFDEPGFLRESINPSDKPKVLEILNTRESKLAAKLNTEFGLTTTRHNRNMQSPSHAISGLIKLWLKMHDQLLSHVDNAKLNEVIIDTGDFESRVKSVASDLNALALFDRIKYDTLMWVLDFVFEALSHRVNKSTIHGLTTYLAEHIFRAKHFPYEKVMKSDPISGKSIQEQDMLATIALAERKNAKMQEYLAAAFVFRYPGFKDAYLAEMEVTKDAKATQHNSSSCIGSDDVGASNLSEEERDDAAAAARNTRNLRRVRELNLQDALLKSDKFDKKLITMDWLKEANGSLMMEQGSLYNPFLEYLETNKRLGNLSSWMGRQGTEARALTCALAIDEWKATYKYSDKAVRLSDAATVVSTCGALINDDDDEFLVALKDPESLPAAGGKQFTFGDSHEVNVEQGIFGDNIFNDLKAKCLNIVESDFPSFVTETFMITDADTTTAEPERRRRQALMPQRMKFGRIPRPSFNLSSLLRRRNNTETDTASRSDLAASRSDLGRISPQFLFAVPKKGGINGGRSDSPTGTAANSSNSTLPSRNGDAAEVPSDSNEGLRTSYRSQLSAYKARRDAAAKVATSSIHALTDPVTHELSTI